METSIRPPDLALERRSGFDHRRGARRQAHRYGHGVGGPAMHIALFGLLLTGDWCGPCTDRRRLATRACLESLLPSWDSVMSGEW